MITEIHNEISILPSEENDLEEVLKLQKEAYQQEAEIYNDYDIPPLKQTIESLRQEWKKGIILKAVINGRLVGSIRAYLENNTCYVGKLIVNRNSQNKGIGKLLMKEIENKFNNVERFELFTGYKSEKNLYIYRKLGYKDFKIENLKDDFQLIYLEKPNIDG